jgi:outer membrane protein TolC
MSENNANELMRSAEMKKKQEFVDPLMIALRISNRRIVMILEMSSAIIPRGWLHASIVVLVGFTFFAGVRAQVLPETPSANLSPEPTPGPTLVKLLERPALLPVSEEKAANTRSHDTSVDPGLPAASSGSAAPAANPRRITLEQAQQAAAAANPMAHIAQLQVEAARQHRLGTESDYFPKLSSTLTNFHFNKFMGQEITIQRPIAGGTVTAGLPLSGKDQTLVAVTAAQPLTPLFKLHEVVNIARADERLAMAKAGMPVETASNVEKAYYGLLVAQRQFLVAKANADSFRNEHLLASNTSRPRLVSDHEDEEIATAKALVIAGSKVKELTASLNVLLGYPVDTELELVCPVTEMEDISFKEASDKAMAANPEVVEAESNVAKAHAASRLSKLDYVPDVAVMGGYAYNDNAIPLLPRDFSFIGIMGSYTLFDFGKREHTIKERNAQVGMAETALELTKAKVASAVKTSYFEMDRARQLSELARRMSAAISVRDANYKKDDPDLAAAQAKVEVEIFQADLEYRQALAQLKTLMGEK